MGLNCCKFFCPRRLRQGQGYQKDCEKSSPKPKKHKELAIAALELFLCFLLYAIALLGCNQPLEPKRLQIVQPRANKSANLILIEAMRGGKSGLIWEPTLVLQNDDGTYTEEFKRIYHID